MLDNSYVPDRHICYGFPVREVSDECSREKSIRIGHISTLQMWWARRPLAVSRAAIFSALCPSASTIEQSPELIRILNSYDDSSIGTVDKLNKLIIELSNWDNRNHQSLINIASNLVKTHLGHTPLVADSFSGGGSIPLEAQRLGFDSYAGELNPVAYFPLKQALELYPQLSDKDFSYLRSELIRLGQIVDNEMGPLYPTYHGQLPVAYLWTKNFLCPHCGARAILLPNKWLRKPKNSKKGIAVKIHYEDGHAVYDVYEPQTSADLQDANTGSIRMKDVVCLCCHKHISTDFVQTEGKNHRLGEEMYAVCVYEGKEKKYYPANCVQQYQYCAEEKKQLDATFPSEPFDVNGIRHTWAYQYGIERTGDLYSYRQKKALLLLLGILEKERDQILNRDQIPAKLKESLVLLLMLVFNRVSLYCNRHTWWQSNGEFAANMYGHNSIPMVWSFIEIPINSHSTGGWFNACDWLFNVTSDLIKINQPGHTYRGDAANIQLQANSVDLFIIDPPYYDSIAYSYLSDVFYVFMKRFLGGMYPGDFVTALTPKTEEAIVDRFHSLGTNQKGDDHFRKKMYQSFLEANRVLRDDGIMVVMYGHKQVKAWAAIIEPILDAGFELVTSWPIYMERKEKYSHNKIASLGSSSLLICKKSSSREKTNISFKDFSARLNTYIQKKIDGNVKLDLFGVDLESSLYIPACSLLGQYSVQMDDGTLLHACALLKELPTIIEDNTEQFVCSHIAKYNLQLLEDCNTFVSTPTKSLRSNQAIINTAECLIETILEGNIASSGHILDTLSFEELVVLLMVLKYFSMKKSHPDSKTAAAYDAAITHLGILIRKRHKLSH